MRQGGGMGGWGKKAGTPRVRLGGGPTRRAEQETREQGRAGAGRAGAGRAREWEWAEGGPVRAREGVEGRGGRAEAGPRLAASPSLGCALRQPSLRNASPVTENAVLPSTRFNSVGGPWISFTVCHNRCWGPAHHPTTRPKGKDKEMRRGHSTSLMDKERGGRNASVGSRGQRHCLRRPVRLRRGPHRSRDMVFCTVRHAARWGRMCSGSRKSGQYTRLRPPDHPRAGSNAARVRRRGGESMAKRGAAAKRCWLDIRQRQVKSTHGTRSPVLFSIRRHLR